MRHRDIGYHDANGVSVTPFYVMS